MFEWFVRVLIDTIYLLDVVVVVSWLLVTLLNFRWCLVFVVTSVDWYTAFAYPTQSMYGYFLLLYFVCWAFFVCSSLGVCRFSTYVWISFALLFYSISSYIFFSSNISVVNSFLTFFLPAMICPILLSFAM